MFLFPLLSCSREMAYSELKSRYQKVSSIENAQTGWEEEYDISCSQVNLVTSSDEIIKVHLKKCLHFNIIIWHSAY